MEARAWFRESQEMPRDSGVWSSARFPSRELRQDFLDRLSVWSKAEGLPHFEVWPLHDGLRVLFHSNDPRRDAIRRLIDAFGGFVSAGRASGVV